MRTPSLSPAETWRRVLKQSSKIKTAGLRVWGSVCDWLSIIYVTCAWCCVSERKLLKHWKMCKTAQLREITSGWCVCLLKSISLAEIKKLNKNWKKQNETHICVNFNQPTIFHSFMIHLGKSFYVIKHLFLLYTQKTPIPFFYKFQDSGF